MRSDAMVTVFMLIATLIASPARPEGWDIERSAGYVNALRTADRFLSAWSEKDAASGLALLSAHLLSQSGADQLHAYFEGLSNPRHLSFEIGPGTATDSTRFVFPVVLYEYYLNEPTGKGMAATIDIVLQEDGWRVDKVPPTRQ